MMKAIVCTEYSRPPEALQINEVEKPVPRDEEITDLEFLRELIESGKIKPIIDRCYSMEQVVGEHIYVQS